MSLETENANRNHAHSDGFIPNGILARGHSNVEQLVFTLAAPLDLNALTRAWKNLCLRHALFYNGMDAESADRSSVKPPVETIDWRDANDEAQQEARLDQLLREDRGKGFDADAPGCQLRVRLILLPAEQCRVALSVRHGLLDWRSYSTLLRELLNEYRAGSDRGEHHEVAAMVGAGTAGSETAAGDNDDADFWRRYLNGTGESPSIDLPTHDDPGGAHEAERHENPVVEARLESGQAESLRRLRNSAGVSLSNVAQAAWSLLLARYTGEHDIVFGVARPCRQRGNADARAFINTLPMRCKVNPRHNVYEMLWHVRDQFRALREHECTPLRAIKRAIGVADERVLFDSIIEFDLRDPVAGLEAVFAKEGLSGFRHYAGTRYPLALQFYGEDEIVVRVKYRQDRHDRGNARQLLRHYMRLLTSMAQQPWTAVGELPLLEEAEKAPCRWPGPQRLSAAGKSRTLHGRFADQAAKTPDAVAVSCEERSITYAELDRAADKLAVKLQARGVKPDALVGLCMDRSIEQLVGILGILKSGAGYLPLDPDYPSERLSFLLRDSGTQVVVTSDDVQQRLSLTSLAGNSLQLVTANADEIEDDRKPRPLASDENIAYVIYTSGSTGQPKGVQVTHHNVARLFDACQSWLNAGIGDVWTMFHSFAFDFSVWEIWGALLHGGRLEIVPKDIARSPENFYSLLQERGVTVLNQTPSAFSQLMKVDANAGGQLPALRLVVFGGEALDIGSLLPWIERHGDDSPRLVNMYGITETTVHVTFRQVMRKDAEAFASGNPPSGSPIGWPLPDLYVRLLDAGGKPVPPGVPGEICVGGAGVTRGYLNRPELNERHFVGDPLDDQGSARLYRSGDFARQLPNGELSFIGRRDDQVKIRGFRIDLGEISNTLRRLPGIDDGIATVREVHKGDRRLVAYYVAADETVTEARLREMLAEQLPAHMMPAALIRLHEIPTNANNKVDFKALPGIAEAGSGQLAPEELPATPTEKVLASIWSEVLDRRSVRRDDDFFSLGGDSIIALQVVSKSRAKGIEITPRDLFNNSSLAALARVARQASDTGDAAMEQEGSFTPTPVQHWFAEQQFSKPDHWNQAYLFRLPSDCDVGLLEKACLAVVRHHDALHSRYFHDGEAGWQAEYVDPDEAFEFSHVELDHLDGRERRDALPLIAREIQDSLSISSGLITRMAHFSGGLEDGDRLLIVIHQLAIDPVSWSILLEDLESAYGQLLAGRDPQLPARTTAFGKWAERLARHAQSASVAAERAYWQRVMEAPAGDLWTGAGRRGKEADAGQYRFQLDAQETRALLGEVHDAYGTETNELLLAGLARACAEKWPDCHELRIDIQNHGRDHEFDDIDVNRTVGWFSNLHPVVLDLEKTRNPARSICDVKSRMRSVSSHGLGWGLLRYLASPRLLPMNGGKWQPARVLFNYLGRHEQLLGTGRFQLVNEDCGVWRAPENHRTHDLEIIGQVRSDRLEFAFHFSPEAVPASDVKAFAETMATALRDLIAHCRTRDRAIRTPADFPLARLSQDELDAFPVSLEHAEDVLPLSPLQRLYHALAGSDQDVGFDQWVFQLEGRIDEVAFEEAWRELLRRHDALRTVFVDHGLAEPHQVVLRHVEFHLQRTDWRLLSGEEQQRRLAEFLSADRRQGFELGVAPLTRVTLIRTAVNDWTLVWSHHQAQADGWSWPILARELGEIYDALRAGRRPELPPPGSYRAYIQWLMERDLDEYAGFWRDHLGLGRGSRSLISRTRRAGDGSRGPARTTRKHVDLARDLSNAVRRFARDTRLTPSVLFQGAWGLVLAGMTGRFDVTLGAAFSGRTAGIPVAENTVGPFVNDLPVRLRIDPNARVDRWIESLRGLQADLNHYQNVSPTEIHRWSGNAGAGRLFDTLLVLQNYVTGEAAERWGKAIRVKSFTAGMRTNYPLSVAITPGDSFSLDFFYDESLIDSATIKMIARHLVTVLNVMTSNPDVHIDTVLTHIGTRSGEIGVRQQDETPRPGRRNRRISDRAQAQESKDANGDFVPHGRDTLEGRIAAVCREVLDLPDIRLEQNFFDLGAQSVSLIEIHARLQQQLDKTFPIVKLFQYPTVAALSRYLDAGEADDALASASRRGAARRAAMLRRRQQSHQSER